VTAAAILAAPYAPAAGGSDSFALAVTLTTYSVAESAATSTITTVSTITANPTGGTPPYAYTWVRSDESDDFAINASSPSSATTTFRRTGCSPGDTYIAYFQSVVSDALGAVVFSSFATISISRT